MAFFLITNSQENKFVRAVGFGPTKDMPFLDEIAWIKERRLAYWRVNPEPPGIEIDRPGKYWPSFLKNLHRPPDQFVSSDVINYLANVGITFARTSQMPLAKNRSKLSTDSAPAYFVVEARPGIEVDYAASGLAVGSDGEPIFTQEQRLSSVVKVLRYSSWQGQDLFTISNNKGMGYLRLFCTDRVVELAKEKGWTNVSFEPQIVV